MGESRRFESEPFETWISVDPSKETFRSRAELGKIITAASINAGVRTARGIGYSSNGLINYAYFTQYFTRGKGGRYSIPEQITLAKQVIDEQSRRTGIKESDIWKAEVEKLLKGS
ncbi:MAG: hypothetical protein JO026_03650 [Patescibacteria group bacterium]|nr:hypothetical protein [Patescibacteria group bacterium]